MFIHNHGKKNLIHRDSFKIVFLKESHKSLPIIFLLYITVSDSLISNSSINFRGLSLYLSVFCEHVP